MKHNFSRRAGALLLTLALALSLAAPAWAADPYYSIKITPSGFSDETATSGTLTVGESATLTAELTSSPDNDCVWHWSSSDPSVVSIDPAEGSTVTLTARKEGHASISVSFELNNNTTEGGQAQDVFYVTVEPDPNFVPVADILLDSNSLNMNAGETEWLTAAVLPSNATDQTVTWGVDDGTVAELSVSPDDSSRVEVRAMAPGRTIITAEAGGIVAECDVTVAEGSLSINTYNAEDNPLILDWVGREATLIATVVPASAKITWSSDKPSVAKVDAGSGRVTAVGIGRAIITARVVAGSTVMTASCAVEVSGVVLNTYSLNLVQGGGSVELTCTAYGSAAKGTAQRIWQTSDPSIVAVDRSLGRITPRNAGTAEITLTYSTGGSVYTAGPCVVTVREDTSSITEGNATAGAPYMFSDILNGLKAACPGTLSYITNLSVPTSEGILYYNHVSSDDTGFGVGSSESYYYDESTVGVRYISGLTFVPNSDFNGQTTITYTGFTTAGKSYTGRLRLEVTGAGQVTYVTKSGSPVVFQNANFNAACRALTGRDLNYVSFELPDENRGAFYYDYTGAGQYRYAVTEEEQYFRSRALYLDKVSYVPAENYIGTFLLPFYGVDTAGTSFTGYINIIVVPVKQSSAYDGLTYTALRGNRVDFTVFDFSAACRRALNEELSYVRFTPPESRLGKLYYNYRSSGDYDSLVNANTRYYASRAPRIADLSFVPAAGTMEPVIIRFSGYGISGKSFEGNLTLYFWDEGSDGVISYAVSSGQAVPFEAADFDALCQEITGKDLSRIMFLELPDASEGSLYYNYNSGSNSGNAVTLKTVFYKNSYPQLSGVAFAPKSDFLGEVELAFTGYDTSGGRFHGTVRIEVEEGNTTLHYMGYPGTALFFRPEDFNDICRSATGGTLNYVSFKLPAASQGTLYWRSSSTSSAWNRVNANSSYYYSSSSYSNRLGNVFFVPASDYTGPVSFEYTGVSVSGARFTGMVEITVGELSSASLYYTVTQQPFALSGEDFRDGCGPALMQELSYVTFNALPQANQGRLYWNYTQFGTGTAVGADSKSYYNKAPSLDSLVFVAKAGYTGTVELPYTAYDAGGNLVTGTVYLTVTQPTDSSFSDMGYYGWAASSVEFLYGSGVTVGTGSTTFSPAGDVKRGDFVLMLCRMYGLFTNSSVGFYDVPEDSYYAQAIASARAKGIVSAADWFFYPEAPITRQDAMVMLYKAMRAAGKSIPAGGIADLYPFADYANVAADAREAMGAMVRAGILMGNTLNQLKPTHPITRAEMATVLHRAMTL